MPKKQATIEDLEKELWLRVRNAGNIVWFTKKGEQIPINEMSDEHLVNTLKMLYRNKKVAQELLQYNNDCWEALASIGDTEF
jgi:hypothetical protein